MTRYIDGDHLKSWILARWEKEPNSAYPLKAREILYQIDREMEYPLVDAVPVRHGEWIPCRMDSRGCTDMFKCSECKRYSYYAYGVKRLDYKYCPHCGARMDEE